MGHGAWGRGLEPSYLLLLIFIVILEATGVCGGSKIKSKMKIKKQEVGASGARCVGFGVLRVFDRGRRAEVTEDLGLRTEGDGTGRRAGM